MNSRSEASEAIRLEGLNLQAPSGSLFLEDGCAAIPAGARCAVLCEEEPARLALLRALLRIESPRSGAIWIGGEDLAFVQTSRLRCLLGLVPATPILLPGTLWENVVLGRKDACAGQVMRSMCEAGLNAIALQRNRADRIPYGPSPDRVTSTIARRIALARCLLWNPAILLFDEPGDAGKTGYVDPLWDRLPAATQGRTLLAIGRCRDGAIGTEPRFELREGRLRFVGPRDRLLANRA